MRKKLLIVFKDKKILVPEQTTSFENINLLKFILKSVNRTFEEIESIEEVEEVVFNEKDKLKQVYGSVYGSNKPLDYDVYRKCHFGRLSVRAQNILKVKFNIEDTVQLFELLNEYGTQYIWSTEGVGRRFMFEIEKFIALLLNTGWCNNDDVSTLLRSQAPWIEWRNCFKDVYYFECKNGEAVTGFEESLKYKTKELLYLLGVTSIEQLEYFITNENVRKLFFIFQHSFGRRRFLIAVEDICQFLDVKFKNRFDCVERYHLLFEDKEEE